MSKLTEKIRSANFVGVSIALHTSAIAAIALGPTLMPGVLSNEEPAGERIEFTVASNTEIPNVVAEAPQVEVKPVEAAPAAKDTTSAAEVIKVKPAPEKQKPVAENPKPKVEKTVEPKSVALPEKTPDETLPENAEPTPAEAPQESAVADVTSAAEPEMLTQEESPVEVEQPKEKLQVDQEKLELESKLAAMEAARAAEQAEMERLRQEKEEIARKESEALAQAEAAEAARQAAQQEALENAKKAEQARADAEAKAEKAAAAAAAAKKAEEKLAQQQAAAAAGNQGQGQAQAGQGGPANGGAKTIEVKQNFLELRQMAGNRPPQYPSEMRLKKVEGRGQLVYFVTKEGVVTDIKLTRSTGHPELDREAVTAFKKFKFVPGQEGYTVHNFEFNLKGPAEAADGRLRATWNEGR